MSFPRDTILEFSPQEGSVGAHDVLGYVFTFFQSERDDVVLCVLCPLIASDHCQVIINPSDCRRHDL